MSAHAKLGQCSLHALQSAAGSMIGESDLNRCVISERQLFVRDVS